MYIKLNQRHKPYVPTAMVLNNDAPHCLVTEWLSLTAIVRIHTL